ncbi:hypothetical protein PHYSODRAFT_477483, partial [Phytophthora sojae]
PAARVNVSSTKRHETEIAVAAQMGFQYAQMEVQGQLLTRWPVHLRRRWCPCGYWYAFGSCVHVLYALRVSNCVDLAGRDVLVSRKRKQNNSSAT